VTQSQTPVLTETISSLFLFFPVKQNMNQNASATSSFYQNFGPDQPFEARLTKASVFHNLMSMLPLTSASKPMQSHSFTLKAF
jgi:hypothetical protein